MSAPKQAHEVLFNGSDPPVQVPDDLGQVDNADGGDQQVEQRSGNLTS
jgi:hypothetical protein